MTVANFGELFDTLPDGVLVHDPRTGEILGVNDTYCGMVGYGKRELLGMDLADLAADEEYTATSEFRLQQAKEEGPLRFEWHHETDAGTVVPVEVSLTVTTREGRELAVASIREAEEGPERERLEGRHDRYEALFDNNQLILWEMDLSEAKQYAERLAAEADELVSYLDDHPEELGRINSKIEVLDVNQKTLDFYEADSMQELVENLDQTITEESFEGLKHQWQAVVNGETTIRRECEVRTFEGNLRHELLEWNVPEAYADDYSRVYATSVDITELRERERELERSRDRYRALFESSQIVMLEFDLSEGKQYAEELAAETDDLAAYLDDHPEEFGRVLGGVDVRDVNEKAVEFYRADSKQQVKDHLDELMTSEAFDSWRRLWQAVVDGETTFRTECTNLTFDGNERVVLSELAVPDAHADDYARVYLTALDITERKRREQQLESYELLFENAKDCIIEAEFVDGEPIIKDVNAAFEDVFGYPEAEVVGEHVDDVITPPDYDDEAAEINNSVLEGKDFTREVTRMTADGPREFLLRPSHYDEDVSYAIYTDITERKERERKLEKVNTRLQLALEGTNTGVWERNIETGELVWDDQTRQLFGFESGEFDGRYEQFAEKVHPDDIDDVEAAHEQGFEEGLYQAEYRICPDEETVRWVDARARVVYEDGTPARMVGIVTDITERKQREQELQRKNERLEQEVERRKAAETRYQSLFENNPVVIWEEDLSAAKEFIDTLASEVDDLAGYLDDHPEEVGRIMDRVEVIDVNRNALDYYAAETKSELIESLDQLMTEETMDVLKDLWPQIAEGETQFRAETVSSTLDGDRRHEIMDLYVPEAYAEDYSRVFITGTDITERKQRERELQEKNELLDEFASVVSHDIATPLSVIENKARLVELTGDTSHATDIYDATERVQRLVDELRDLTKQGKQVGETTTVDLETVTLEAWHSVESGRARLTVESTDTLDANRDRLRQLLENLLRNAVDHGSTNPASQTPHAADGSRDHDPVTINVGTRADGFYVEDDGSGIPESERDEVFQQGYTTDEDSTGLGLAIVRRIVNGHGWTIDVTEGADGGARFVITTED